MSTFSLTAFLLARAFSYALLYSLGQGLIIFGLLFLLLKAIPGMSARLRYYLSFSAMALMFVWFADTLVLQYSALQGVTVYITGSPQAGAPVATTIAHTTPVALPAIQPALPQVDRYVPVIAGLYLLGLLLMLVRFVSGILQLRRLGKRDLQEAPARLVAFTDSWRKYLSIGRAVRVAVSSRISVPMMMGVLRPVILLPLSAVSDLSADELEAILLHELAHIKRHDYLVNIIQSAIESLMFFNPFVWLASHIIRREREHCCDDMVLAHSSSPFPYARALAQLEAYRGPGGLSIAATGNSNQLFNRIKRIVEMKREHNPYGRVSAAVIAVLVPALVVMFAAFTPSFAQKSKSAKKAMQKKVTTTTITIDSTGRQNVVKKTTIEPAGRHKKEIDDEVAVAGAGGNKTVTKVIVVDDDDNKGGNKKVKREIIVAGGDNWFDSEKFREEMARAKAEIEGVDWDEIKETIAAAIRDAGKELKAIDVDKITKQIDVEVRKELERSKQAMADAKVEMDHAKRTMARAYVVSPGGSGSHFVTSATPFPRMSHGANPDIEIHSGTDETEEMLDAMEKDGLINREKKFKIEKEDEVLYINGEKQPDRVYHKYNRYLHGKDVAISGSKGNLSISISNK